MLLNHNLGNIVACSYDIITVTDSFFINLFLKNFKIIARDKDLTHRVLNLENKTLSS